MVRLVGSSSKKSLIGLSPLVVARPELKQTAGRAYCLTRQEFFTTPPPGFLEFLLQIPAVEEPAHQPWVDPPRESAVPDEKLLFSASVVPINRK